MDKNIISCGEVLDISMVSKLHDELKMAFEGEQPIGLSVADLQRIDGAGVQLLVAFFAAAEKLHLDVSWQDSSERLIDAATLLGVQQELHLNETVTV